MRNDRLPLDTVIQGDCIQEMNNLPENSIDLIFADPPYNLQLQQELWRPNMTKVNGVDDEWDQFSSFKDYDAFTTKWLTSARRILKDNGTMWVIGSYHNIYRVGSIILDMGFWILNNFTWIKTNPMPNFNGVRFTNSHETLIWFQKQQGKPYTFNHQVMKDLNDGQQMRSDWFLPICSGKERIKVDGQSAHPTQKPEALLYRIIASTSNPGDVVLDPFFGTGTTGAVAKRLQRSYIGIDQSADYIALAENRISQVEPQDDPKLYQFVNKRKRERIPFGMLIENGYLEIGQQLYFGKKSNRVATILANSHLEYEKQRGSIHQIGKFIKGSPCNGWEHWYYIDANDGKRYKIDHLREQLRQEMQKSEDES